MFSAPRLFRPPRLLYFAKISDPPFIQTPPTIRDLRVLGLWMGREGLSYLS